MATSTPHPVALVATPADARAAVADAFARAGLTREQLLDQARSARFETLQARLTWVAVGDALTGTSTSP